MTARCDELSEEEQRRLVAEVETGTSWRAIGKRFGVSVASLKQWVFDHGYVWGSKKLQQTLFPPDPLVFNDTDAEETVHKKTTEVRRLATLVAVQLLKRLLVFLNPDTQQVAPDAKECYTLSIALEKTWATYSRINRLEKAVETVNRIKWLGEE